MTMPAYRRSVRDIKEALWGLLPFYWVCLDSRFLGKLVLSMVSLSQWEARQAGRRTPTSRPVPKGTATDASMEPELLTERLTTSAEAKAR